jgi:hypothetical protein
MPNLGERFGTEEEMDLVLMVYGSYNYPEQGAIKTRNEGNGYKSVSHRSLL